MRRKLASVAIAVVAAMAVLASPAAATTVGVVPPQKPKADCAASSQQVQWTIADINSCRAKEGIGPLQLPSNWNSLTVVQQTFVLINLERVNRGLAAVVGISAPLSTLARNGAAQGTDPAFPSHGFIGGGGLWAGGTSVIGAVDMWMYYDGPNGLDLNLACTSPTAQGCWLHRQIILWGGTGGPLVAGGGFSTSIGYSSYAFEILSGYSTANLTFTWSHELRFFAQRPGLEPLDGHAAMVTTKKSGSHKHRKHHGRRKHHGHRKHSRNRHRRHHRRQNNSSISITIG